MPTRRAPRAPRSRRVSQADPAVHHRERAHARGLRQLRLAAGDGQPSPQRWAGVRHVLHTGEDHEYGDQSGRCPHRLPRSARAVVCLRRQRSPAHPLVPGIVEPAEGQHAVEQRSRTGHPQWLAARPRAWGSGASGIPATMVSRRPNARAPTRWAAATPFRISLVDGCSPILSRGEHSEERWFDTSSSARRSAATATRR